ATVNNSGRNTFLVAQPLEPDRSPFRIVTRCRLSQTVGDIDKPVLQNHMADRVVGQISTVVHIPGERGTRVRTINGAISTPNRGTYSVLVHPDLPVNTTRPVVLDLDPQQAFFPTD